ncbi:MAG: zinc-ribbon domain-containing protein, partial [Lachnospiraceae bacterium]|nr:zinc-ribbon domain-containing protein [Lachnospiraceae bacterium]
MLLGYNDLASQYPDLLKEWNYKKNNLIGIEPNNITPMSGKKVWWICAERHEWEVSPGNRIKYKTGCPYCSNHKTKTGYNDLETLFPAIANEWDYIKNAKLTPRSISGGSNKKVWWICPKGHSYESQINSRTKQGTGCPYCAKKDCLLDLMILPLFIRKLQKSGIMIKMVIL